MRPWHVLGLDHFRKQPCCGLQSFTDILKLAVRKDGPSVNQRQNRLEDQLRIAHYCEQMLAARAVRPRKPILSRPFICTGPSHQCFDGLMAVAQLHPQDACNRRSISVPYRQIPCKARDRFCGRRCLSYLWENPVPAHAGHPSSDGSTGGFFIRISCKRQEPRGSFHIDLPS
jgi:hypothetical protein